MRSASSYRGAKKKAAREAGVPFGRFNEHYQRSRHFAAAELERKALQMTPEGARETLAVWARNGGRATAVSPAAATEELEAMNAASKPQLTEEEAAAKITVEDIDKALENTLTKWQTDLHQEPLPLSRLFAARARALGWVEGVEFEEGKRT